MRLIPTAAVLSAVSDRRRAKLSDGRRVGPLHSPRCASGEHGLEVVCHHLSDAAPDLGHVACPVGGKDRSRGRPYAFGSRDRLLGKDVDRRADVTRRGRVEKRRPVDDGCARHQHDDRPPLHHLEAASPDRAHVLRRHRRKHEDDAGAPEEVDERHRFDAECGHTGILEPRVVPEDLATEGPEEFPSTLRTAFSCAARARRSGGSAVWPTIATSSGNSDSTRSAPAGGPSCQATGARASSRARDFAEKIWSSVLGYGSTRITRRTLRACAAATTAHEFHIKPLPELADEQPRRSRTADLNGDDAGEPLAARPARDAPCAPCCVRAQDVRNDAKSPTLDLRPTSHRARRHRATGRHVDEGDRGGNPGLLRGHGHRCGPGSDPARRAR